MDRIKPRWFNRNLQAALRVLPVTVLTGARQTGKTTLTQALEPSRTYFTLDDVGILDQAERNPDSLLSARPVILDEVQRAPQILLAVKRAVDTSRRAGDFILTGSANLLLMKQVAETLERATVAPEEQRPSVGLGTDVRLSGTDIRGAALLYDESPLHASLFPDNGGDDPSNHSLSTRMASPRRRRSAR